MRDAENIAQVAALKPDCMGFIFYDKSPRYVGGLDPAVVKNIDPEIMKVGVFVNETPEIMISKVLEYDLDAVQLHGEETPAVCMEMTQICRVIKAFGVSDADDILFAVNNYADVADWLLFDTKTQQHGGSGRKFDWEFLSGYGGEAGFFLSGGISPEDAGEVAGINIKGLWAIDINSRFEKEPGVKDVEKLKEFFKTIKR